VAPFFMGDSSCDPRSHFSLPMGQNSPLQGGSSRLRRDPLRRHPKRQVPRVRSRATAPRKSRLGMTRATFCSEKHYYAFRDRRRYAENREAQLERARRYYAEHREEILEKAARRRGRSRPAKHATCSECGTELTGRQRVACSPHCRDARYRRPHPDEYAANEARKVERRREARRKEREA